MSRKWLALSLALGGCSTTTYGYQYRMQQHFAGGDEPEPAPREARELLANAKTVAFYPPDECVNSDSSMARERQAEIHAKCGAAMSALERAAEDAGYEVLSWQNLRGSKRPIEYAREGNVDVLFEVNQIEATVLDDMTAQHDFTFFEGDGTGSDTPLAVSTSVAETCRDYAFKADQPKAAALSGTIDIKLVSVADGRDRWHYATTAGRSLERDYPRVRFTAPNQPSSFGTALAIIGGVSASLGLGLALGEATSMDNPMTPANEKFDSGGWSSNLLIGGAVLVAAGALVSITSTTEPDPAKTLCNSTFAVATPVPAKVDVMSSEHTFEQTHTGDDLAEAKKQIIAGMTKQFIDELKAAKASRPRTATTPPPVPTPAPGAPAPPSGAAVPAPAPPPAPAPAHP